MNDRSVTLVISDLHVGGGAKDPGDDHVYDKDQLRHFIDEQSQSPEGKKGDVELVINGDFLEFAQVEPNVYTLGSAKYWCSESESLLKLQAITTGHADIFEAMMNFQKLGNQITLAAGNHDVDLYWPAVQAELRRVTGPLSFETGNVWYSRYGGLLRISHGHMFDPANKFERWSDPITPNAEGQTSRLEMCPGTLFMVKFVNWLEEKYPFADNLKPVTALGRILWGENRFGLLVVSWMLSRFAARHPNKVAGLKEANEQIGLRLVEKIQFDDQFAADVTDLYREVRDQSATVETVRLNLNDEDSLFDFLSEMLPLVEPAKWMPVFEEFKLSSTLGIENPGISLAIKAGNSVDKEFLWKKAEEELLADGGPQVVVMGHTHQPDDRESDGGGRYYNPGSWTRFVDYEKNPGLTLDDLKDDKAFPFQLNFVRVEKLANDSLKSEQITYLEGI
jgi:UDP-2,3-diacylglucosamine pyrophosphatase LpxH